MAVSSKNTLKQVHDQAAAIADRAVTSDFTAVIKGFADTSFLISGIPWANLSAGEPLEVPLPMGLMKYQPTQAATHKQGGITLQETVTGAADALLVGLLMEGGTFEMVVYNGLPSKFTLAKRYRDCSISTEMTDRTFEDRTTPLVITGTISFTYIGDDIPGNVETLNG